MKHILNQLDMMGHRTYGPLTNSNPILLRYARYNLSALCADMKISNYATTRKDPLTSTREAHATKSSRPQSADGSRIHDQPEVALMLGRLGTAQGPWFIPLASPPSPQIGRIGWWRRQPSASGTLPHPENAGSRGLWRPWRSWRMVLIPTVATMWRMDAMRERQMMIGAGGPAGPDYRR